MNHHMIHSAESGKRSLKVILNVLCCGTIRQTQLIMNPNRFGASFRKKGVDGGN